MSDIIETEFTDDEKLLLIFQKAKVEYTHSALTGDTDCEFEHAYHQSILMLENLQDPILRDLAKEIQGPGKRSYEAEQELLCLSLRVANLFPQISLLIN